MRITANKCLLPFNGYWNRWLLKAQQLPFLLHHWPGSYERSNYRICIMIRSMKYFFSLFGKRDFDVSDYLSQLLMDVVWAFREHLMLRCMFFAAYLVNLEAKTTGGGLLLFFRRIITCEVIVDAWANNSGSRKLQGRLVRPWPHLDPCAFCTPS